jgi:hypothetical protein
MIRLEVVSVRAIVSLEMDSKDPNGIPEPVIRAFMERHRTRCVSIVIEDLDTSALIQRRWAAPYRGGGGVYFAGRASRQPRSPIRARRRALPASCA